MTVSGWRPPVGVLPRIRWAYLTFVCFFTVTFIPQLTVISAQPTALKVAAVSALCLLTLWWARGYRRGSFPAAGIPLEAAAMFVVAVTPIEPVRAMGLLFIGLSFRTLYGGWAHAMCLTAAAITAFLTAQFVAPVLGSPAQFQEFFQALPGVPALAVITHFMVVAMERGERAAAREREISAASLALARATTTAELQATAAASAMALLPDARGATARLDLSAAAPVVSGGVVLPVTARDTTLGHLVVDSGTADVPSESRAALEALTHSLGLSLTTLGLYADLRVRAEQDALTGLANRASLHTRLAELVHVACRDQRRSTLHVLLIDLDRFKDVNDTSGHAAGDVVLQVTASRLRGSVRSDDIVARLGGDEFAVVLTRGTVEGYRERAAERVRAAMSEPVVLPSGATVTVGVSVGGATWRAPMSADDLLHAADMAMYAHKRAGRVGVGVVG